jgi:hypothetical protein
MAEMGARTDWANEETYWRNKYRDRPYVRPGQNYDAFGPAYRFGYEATDRYPGKSWSDVESHLQGDWDRYEHRGQSTWSQIKGAVRDAWDRVTGHHK